MIGAVARTVPNSKRGDKKLMLGELPIRSIQARFQPFLLRVISNSTFDHDGPNDFGIDGYEDSGLISVLNLRRS